MSVALTTSLLFDHQKMPSQEALVVNLPPYREWAGFKWLLQECSLPPPLCPASSASSYKTSQRTLYSTCAPLPSLSRASGISGMPINDGRRGEVSSGSVEANMQRHRSQRGRLSLLHRLLHSFAHSRFCLLKLFVRGGTKKDMGVKSAIELYNPVLLFSAFSIG